MAYIDYFVSPVPKSRLADHKKLAMGHYLENEAAVENYLIHMRHDEGLLKEMVHDKITFASLDIRGLAERAADILEGGEWKPWARRRKKPSSAT